MKITVTASRNSDCCMIDTERLIGVNDKHVIEKSRFETPIELVEQNLKEFASVEPVTCFTIKGDLPHGWNMPHLSWEWMRASHYGESDKSIYETTTLCETDTMKLKVIESKLLERRASGN